MSNQPFPGQRSGIRPQIDFKGAINTSAFTGGVTALTLDIKGDTDAKIGQLTAPLTAAAISSYDLGAGRQKWQQSLYAISSNPDAFYGGLPSDRGNAIQTPQEAVAVLSRLNSAFLANYAALNGQESTLASNQSFVNATTSYSAAYGSGIEAGKTIRLTLDAPAASDAIVWKAALPITVSYQ